MSDLHVEKKFDIDVAEIALTIWNHKLVIFFGTLICVILAVIYSYLLPVLYTSKSVFLPVGSGGSSAGNSQIAGLASLAGMNLSSLGENSKKIQTLLSSRTLREKIVDSLNLVDDFEVVKVVGRDPKRVAVGMLEKMVRIGSGSNGEIELSVETKDPNLSQSIAAQYVIELEAALNRSNLQQGMKERDLNESQIKEQSQRLKKAQEALANFQLKNKILDPNSQASSYSQIFIDLYSKKIQLEIQRKQLESAYNSTDSRVISINNQIDSIDKQISEFQNNQSTFGGVALKDTPLQVFEYQNLTREFEISSRLYASLLSSLEQSNLTNGLERVFVEVIDPPLVPEERSSPNRVVIALVGFLVGIFISVTFIFLKETIKSIKKEYLEKN